MTVVACSGDSPPTPGIVQFNSAEFLAAFPEFAITPAAPDAALAMNFALATLNLSNCCGSPVPDPNVRQSLLYLLTAHLTALFTPSGQNNSQPPGIVGRIDSATEGSVSVHADFPATAESAWFLQTKYGAAFWQATAVLRTMHHVPAPQDCCGGLGPLGFEGFGYAEGNWNGYGE
jgi:hypothetical protein